MANTMSQSLDRHPEPAVSGADLRAADNAAAEQSSGSHGRSVAGPPTGRLIGVDIARGLALIGMFTQHIDVARDDETSSAWVGWFFTESAGRASVLFFVLSGVSLSLVHRRGSASAMPAALRRRGLLLLVGGLLLTTAFWWPSILQHYGVMFLLAPWLIRLGPRGLLAVSALGLVGGPIATFYLSRWTGDVFELPVGETGTWLVTTAWDLLVSGTYPLLIWVGFFAVGILLGRLDLRPAGTAIALVAVGAVASVSLGLIAGSIYSTSGEIDASSDWDDGSLGSDGSGELVEVPELTRADLETMSIEELDEYAQEIEAVFAKEYLEYEKGYEVDGDWHALADTTGHSGAMGWTLQTSAIAVTVLGLALLAAQWLNTMLQPIAILGSMSLTAYLVHIVLVNEVWDNHVSEQDWSVVAQEWVFLALVVVMTVTCLLIHRLWRSGPLERVLKDLTQRPPADQGTAASSST